MAKKYYVVWNGNETGLFDSWTECKIAVEGYPGARYKGLDRKSTRLNSSHLA